MLHIGIDPGTKTGIAIWDGEKFHLVETVGIYKAMRTIVVRNDQITDARVKLCVEDPNTRVRYSETSKREADMKRQGAGSVKRDFAIWKEFAAYYGYDFEPVRLQGNLKKVKPDLFQKMTGWTSRTSEHSRDAAMMVFKRR